MKLKSCLALVLLIFGSMFLSSCRDVETIRQALEEHTIPGAKYVGSETCATCHEAVAKKMKLSAHARITIPGENYTIEGCEMCHGPGSLHVDADTKDKQKTIINPKKNPERCFSCHVDKKAQIRLPFHHPILEGKMSCSDCHEMHGENSRPWSLTSVANMNEVCFKCHKDQRGPFVFGHEALREGCQTCHQVHGSVNDKMLIARDATLCLRCHSQQTSLIVGLSDHSSRLTNGTCYSGGCHTAPHGSNFDDHLRY